MWTELSLVMPMEEMGGEHQRVGNQARASAESLTSENASRLASMQGAERNIEERLEQLTQRYHRGRQMAITEELLDIVTGFEALRK
jgi:F0F1-type ATP synthase gamma subunit